MRIEPHRIRMDPESELARNGELYRLTKEVDSRAGYDPEKVKAAIRNTTGSWADSDADTFIPDLYRAREEGTRPADRP